MGRGSNRGSGRRHSRSGGRRRKSSAAVRWIRAKPWHLIAATAVVLGGTFFLAGADRGRGSDFVANAARLLRDPLLAFDSRSPGEREAGALTQTKARLAAAPHTPGPHERVLSQIRERPVAGGAGAPDGIAGPLGLPVLGGEPIGFPGQGFAGPAGFPGGSVGPVGGDGPGGAGGPPAGPLGYNAPPPSETPSSVGSASAVPEPATWAMMLVGFFAIGFALRRAGGMLRPGDLETDGDH